MEGIVKSDLEEKKMGNPKEEIKEELNQKESKEEKLEESKEEKEKFKKVEKKDKKIDKEIKNMDNSPKKKKRWVLPTIIISAIVVIGIFFSTIFILESNSL